MWHTDVYLPEMQKTGGGVIFPSRKDPGFVDRFDVNSPGLLHDVLVYKQGKHLGNFFLLAALLSSVWIVVWTRLILNLARDNTCFGFVS